MAPGARGPGAAAAPGGRAGGRGGIPLTFRRQATSKKLLKVDWDFPAALDAPKEDASKTRASARMVALPREEILKRLTENDKRPLLVFRECNVCKGTDDALLDRKMNVEKTTLMMRWFHCVKFKPNVLEKNHTYHNLFTAKPAPHMFLCSADGSDVVPLGGRVPQGTMWKAMQKLLEKEYQQDAEKAVKEILRVMANLDHLDSMAIQYREQYEAAVEKAGPKSPKLRRISAKLKKLEAERAEALARKDKASELGLKRAKAKPAKATK